MVQRHTDKDIDKDKDKENDKNTPIWWCIIGATSKDIKRYCAKVSGVYYLTQLLETIVKNVVMQYSKIMAIEFMMVNRL